MDFRTRNASAALQRKLERFIRDDSQRELIVKHWTSYRQAVFYLIPLIIRKHLLSRRSVYAVYD